MRRYVLTLVGVLLLGTNGHAKQAWENGLDLEPSLRSAALVMAARVKNVREVPVVSGGKSAESFYEFTFAPLRVMKGVYARSELKLTSRDLRPYAYRRFDTKDIDAGQVRLLVLGRSSVGYVGLHAGTTADQALPLLEDDTDSLLDAVEILLDLQDQRDRQIVVDRLGDALAGMDGRGAVVLLASLDRRAYLAAQQTSSWRSVREHLTSNDVLVRTAAAQVAAALLRADYLGDESERQQCVAGIVAALTMESTSVDAKVAALIALAAGVDAVRGNPRATALVALDAHYDTFGEYAARLDVVGRLPTNAATRDQVSEILAKLPLDAPVGLQRAAARAWGRLAGTDAHDGLVARMRRKKALGLGVMEELQALDVVFATATDAGSIRRTVLDLHLTPAEQEVLLVASRDAAGANLVPALADMLDPRHSSLRRRAAELLVEIDTKSAARALRNHLANETDLGFKLRIAAFLGKHGFTDGYAYALEHMSEPGYRDVAVEAIAAIDRRGSTREMVEIYGSSNDANWRRAAIRALGLLGSTALEAETLAVARQLTHPLAPAALRALADLGNVEVLPLLSVALESRDRSVAYAATKAAGPMIRDHADQSTALRDGLARLARDPLAADVVRRQALDDLFDANDPRVDDVLADMARDMSIEGSGLLPRVRTLLQERRVRL